MLGNHRDEIRVFWDHPIQVETEPVVAMVLPVQETVSDVLAEILNDECVNAHQIVKLLGMRGYKIMKIDG